MACFRRKQARHRLLRVFAHEALPCCVGLIIVWAHASAGVTGNGQDDELFGCMATGLCKQHCPAAAHAGYRFCALKRFSGSSTAEDPAFYVPGTPKQKV